MKWFEVAYEFTTRYGTGTASILFSAWDKESAKSIWLELFPNDRETCYSIITISER